MPMLYAIAERRPATLSLAHWFDVCPDDVARADANRLIADPPRVIVWQVLDEELIEVCEKQFRNGNKSGQRDLIRAFDQIRPLYDLVYSTPGTDPHTVQIFLRRG
jgi:hypothetical protein